MAIGAAEDTYWDSQAGLESHQIYFDPSNKAGADPDSACKLWSRARSLFDGEPVIDMLDKSKNNVLWDATEPRAEQKIFELKPSAFIHKARNLPPVERKATASDFAAWIYSLYSKAHGDAEDRTAGKIAEQGIWREFGRDKWQSEFQAEREASRLHYETTRRNKITSCADGDFLRQKRPEWRLIHNGLHVENNSSLTPIILKQLRVQSQPLVVSPDLVYFNEAESHLLICEIKFSQMTIPVNLWPNIWGQLWCYSQIPEAIQASRVSIVGEIWGERSLDDDYPCHFSDFPGGLRICLRASVRRDPRLPAFDRFFRTLFEIYAGHD